MGRSRVNRALRKARKQAGYSIVEAAYRVGAERSTWERWEGGGLHPSLTMAFRIVWLLGGTIEELFGEIADDTKGFFDPDQDWMVRHYGKE